MKRLSVAFLFLCALNAGHTESEPEIFIQHQAGEYTLQMNLLVDNEPHTVLDLLTDFNHLNVLSPAIESSELLGVDPDGASLVKTVVSDCVLFFCKTMKRVEKVVIAENGRVTSQVLPEQSDFSYGESVWVVSPLDDQVSIRYQSRLVPKFSVPPGIGPVMVKYVMKRELRQMAEMLQRAE